MLGLLANLRTRLRLIGHPARLETAVAFGGTDTASGEQVSPETALTFSAVYAAVNLLSRSVASLPLWVYRRFGETGRQRDSAHPLHRLLHDAPNPDMTAFSFREAMQAHVLTWGNAFALIGRNQAGRVVSLTPIHPARVSMGRDDAGVYTYRIDGGPDVIHADDMLHLKALSRDGLFGMSPVALARESIAAGIACEKFGARFFGNQARPSGVLKYPRSLTPEQIERIRKSWSAAYGQEGSHGTAILEMGMEWQPFTIPPDDAQFLQTRQFTVTEIARWFGVPPHMIGDLSRATFSNIEHQGIEFVTYSLMPWLVNWEQELARKLLSAAEREDYFIEHSPEALLRGDVTSRYAAYQTALLNGFLSIDEVRAKENLNPLPDGAGQGYHRPANLVRVGDDDDEADDDTEDKPAITGFADGR